MKLFPHEVPPTGSLAKLAANLRAGVPKIATGRTCLRAIRLEDFPAWAEVLCTDRARWMNGPYNRDDAFTDFAASAGSWLLRGYGCLTIENPATGEVSGFVCLHMEPSVREPELGFFLREEAEGQGLAFEATSALRDWAWAHGLPSLVSYIDPANTRSAGLAERLGARLDTQAEPPDLPGKTIYRYPSPEDLA